MRIIVKVSPESIPEGEVCRVLGYRMSGTLAESIPEGEVCRVLGYRMSGTP
ncbi:MAG: hypothetical protein IPN45_00900 [Actinomycetales bacterium]|nr:hypothetical protein [Actinomycetales bacterium]